MLGFLTARQAGVDDPLRLRHKELCLCHTMYLYIRMCVGCV
uniref:Uncharacterized protein n=1 Tax=Labrus bergylta TaxID=56723 RepID=A0A3Q3MF44_9LABR